MLAAVTTTIKTCSKGCRFHRWLSRMVALGKASQFSLTRVGVPYETSHDLHTVATSNGIAEAGLFVHSELNQGVAPDLELIFGPMM